MVLFRGTLPAPVALIGEAPGRVEDNNGLPFTGDSGKILDELLEEAGIERFAVFNCIGCRPPKNRDPKKDEITACYDRLVELLDLCQPKLLVMMGKVARTKLPRERFPKSAVYEINISHPAHMLYDDSNAEIIYKRSVNELKRGQQFYQNLDKR